MSHICLFLPSSVSFTFPNSVFHSSVTHLSFSRYLCVLLYLSISLPFINFVYLSLSSFYFLYVSHFLSLSHPLFLFLSVFLFSVSLFLGFPPSLFLSFLHFFLYIPLTSSIFLSLLLTVSLVLYFCFLFSFTPSVFVHSPRFTLGSFHSPLICCLSCLPIPAPRICFSFSFPPYVR